MPFTTDDFHDLVRLVEAHPEWRAELRRLVLTDELLALPEQVGVLTEQMTTLTLQVTSLARSVQTLTDDVGVLKGRSLEADYRTSGDTRSGRGAINSRSRPSCPVTPGMATHRRACYPS